MIKVKVIEFWKEKRKICIRKNIVEKKNMNNEWQFRRGRLSWLHIYLRSNTILFQV
jgi:hypothetical protein